MAFAHLISKHAVNTSLQGILNAHTKAAVGDTIVNIGEGDIMSRNRGGANPILSTVFQQLMYHFLGGYWRARSVTPAPGLIGRKEWDPLVVAQSTRIDGPHVPRVAVSS